MTDIHGVTGSPYNVPQTRKKVPVPHSLQRIDLDGGRRAKRSWKDTPVVEIQVGDTVSCVGRVEAVSETILIPDAGAVIHSDEPLWTIRLTNAFEEDFTFGGHERLFAFTPDEP